MPRRSRGAFTLVELLVVIAIIGVLVALLLPAVQAAREAARSLQCKNNLHNLALAVHNYENTNKIMPYAGHVTNSNDLRSGKQFSWMVALLPQLEQQNLFDQFNLKVDAFSQPNEPQAIPLAFGMCPSDNAKGKFLVDSSLTKGKRFAKGNYAAYVSPFHTDLSSEFPGAFIMGRTQEVQDIRDGLSNTVGLSEVRVRANDQDQRGAWALCWTGSTVLSFDLHHGGADNSTFVTHPSSFGQTQPPNNQGPNIDMLYNCTDLAGAQLLKMPCNSFGGGSMAYLSAAPRSNHMGGVHMSLLDGSVKFVRDGIDETTMAYMISINDGHTIQHDKAFGQ
jgi:prepilin-type N-terminal cleavage/methylation domain-containing protein